MARGKVGDRVESKNEERSTLRLAWADVNFERKQLTIGSNVEAKNTDLGN